MICETLSVSLQWTKGHCLCRGDAVREWEGSSTALCVTPGEIPLIEFVYILFLDLVPKATHSFIET
jgi:hypothetical protein